MWQVLLAALLFGSMGGARQHRREPEIAFAALGKPRSSLPSWFAISALAHLLSIFVLLFTIELIRNSNSELRISKEIEFGPYIPIRISHPERSYYPVQGSRRTGPVQDGARRHASVTERINASGPRLIQPNTRNKRRLQQMLPAFVYWLPATFPTLDKAAAPGPPDRARTAVPIADPGAQAPNAESAAASVSLARTATDPNVPVPVSSTVPKRFPESPDSARVRTPAEGDGTSLAAVSIAPRLPAKDEVVSVPQDAFSGDGGSGAGAASADKAGGLPGTEPLVKFVETRSGKLEVREFADGSREIRYPKDGRFDVIIVQATGSDLVPEAGDLLGSRPVQTVYLAVGAGREWVLQYCLARAAELPPLQSGMVVSLGARINLQPPWIRTATLPQLRASSSKTAVFYGTLEANGRFHNMRMLGGARYEPRPELLDCLDKWEFRPAERDGAAAEIEVLLIVPAGA